MYQGRRDVIFKENSKYRRFWNVIKKNDAKLNEGERAKIDFERTFLAQHMQKFFDVLQDVSPEGTVLTSTF